MAQDTKVQAVQNLAHFERLAWLADVPLFIDEERVGRFFDAVVRPEFQEGKVTREVSEDTVKKIKGGLGIKGGVKFKLPAFLSFIVGDAEASAEASASGEVGLDKAKKQSVKVELVTINSAEELEELAVYYLLNHRERLVFNEGYMEDGTSSPWYQPPFDRLISVPRALAFLDFPPGTKFIPTAAEFANGEIVLLYDDLLKQFTGEKGGPVEKYPSVPSTAPEDLRQERKEYWASFDKFFSERKAMRVVESATSRGLIKWIDFRVPLGGNGDTIHLHLAPNGKYASGDFGYYLIARGFKHGLRVVGTLKSEPDMNVLAVYEK